MLADLNPSGGSSAPFGFQAFGGLVFFIAHDAILVSDLWQSDGTPGGTVKALTIPGEQIVLFHALGDTLFVGSEDNGFHLHLSRWRPGEARVPIPLPLEQQIISAPAPGLLLVLNGGSSSYQLFSIADCGDGLVRGGERCDDHNVTSGDCCSSACAIETAAACDDGNACTVVDTCSATAVCGGTVVGFPETRTSLGAPLRAGACATARVPGSLTSRIKRAAGLVARGNKAKKPKQAKKLVTSALAQVTHGEQAAGKAKGHLSAACKAQLVARFGEAVSRVQCLLGQL